DLWAARRQVIKDADAEFFADSGQLLTKQQQDQYMARLFSKRRDLVDSAAVLDHGVVGIYWHGQHAPYIIMYPPSSSVGAAITRSGQTIAETLTRDLTNGSLVIVGRGVITVPRGSRWQAETEIDDVSHGRPHKPRYLVLSEDVDDFRS